MHHSLPALKIDVEELRTEKQLLRLPLMCLA